MKRIFLLVYIMVVASNSFGQSTEPKMETIFDGDDLDLQFILPPGAYATTVLREVLVLAEAERNQDKS
jgi:tRNA(Glu) U13 pseudouridine synthase TruD